MTKKKAALEVLMSHSFEKALNRLSAKDLIKVEDEIEAIMADPSIGQLKKGDLRYLHVHKFKLHQTEMLLGYHWADKRLTLYLLTLGPHENFYCDEKRRRKAHKNMIDP